MNQNSWVYYVFDSLFQTALQVAMPAFRCCHQEWNLADDDFVPPSLVSTTSRFCLWVGHQRTTHKGMRARTPHTAGWIYNYKVFRSIALLLAGSAGYFASMPIFSWHLVAATSTVLTELTAVGRSRYGSSPCTSSESCCWSSVGW